MKEEISNEEIKNIDKVWHELIIVMQKTSDELWKNKLDGASTIEISILSIVERKSDVILKEIVEILGIPSSTLTTLIIACGRQLIRTDRSEPSFTQLQPIPSGPVPLRKRTTASGSTPMIVRKG